MVTLAATELHRISGRLRTCDPKSAIARLGGLLTVPALQANTTRIETLVHLAAAHCHGRRDLRRSEIGHLLNERLGETPVTSLEDPVEDVFVTNVETPEGNRRQFEAGWESSAYSAQAVLDTLRCFNDRPEYRNLLSSALALLRLSDCVAERVGLRRWDVVSSAPTREIRLPSAAEVVRRAHAITFTRGQLDALGVTREAVEPFILRDKDKRALRQESIGHTSLERRPLVDFGDELILGLPHAVSPAIRRFVLSELRQLDLLNEFGRTLADVQARQVDREALFELKGERVYLDLPAPDRAMPSLHSWLLKYDVNKYLHVVLLHDNMGWLDDEGLSSFMMYPENLRANLEEYLNRTADHCRLLPDFVEGMTLLVIGGLGRGLFLDLGGWPHQWRSSVIRISDLLMLANEPDRPITRYLKCIKQKEWVEDKGVSVINANGDYNFYCSWRNMNYQLVPYDFRVAEGSVLLVSTDMVLPVRTEVRRLADRHVLEMPDGTYWPVVRFGRDVYFKSMEDRPIYASLGHLRMGTLAGAVETARGPSWLVAEPREGGEEVRRLLYDVWSGFIGLYDRLVSEVENLCPDAPAGPVEIRLDFSEVTVPDEHAKPQLVEVIGEPGVRVDLQQRTARVRFPSSFLTHFQQPENTGERLVVRSIAKGLVSLHRRVQAGIDEAILDDLTDRVIGGAGTRILHLFHTYYPIEQLLLQQRHELVFLAREDLSFLRLGLSEGCTTAQPGTSIVSKAECNDFLHKVVDKLWNQLRILLRQFDRASVARKVIEAHEAILQDRDQWRRTAQAVLALYAPDGDVFAVAHERELDRSKVSVCVRTILEMAVCECPQVGGRQLSRWDLDELLAKAVLLIEAAMDSDAIKGDLTEPTIDLHLNGDYTINREFHTSVIKPFHTDYFREEFQAAARDYRRLYQRERPIVRTRADEVFSADFIEAFQAEFGLTPDEAVDGVAALMDLAVERNSVIVETTLGDLNACLTSAGSLSPAAAQAFVRTFSVSHRPKWDEPPTGFRKQDLYPWRFRRRLSVAARPVLVFGEQDSDKVFFGAGMLRAGAAYLIGRSEDGQLPQEFFVSKEMAKYVGAVNSSRGHAFAQSVAEQLEKHGWHTRTEVQMTELGGPSELGDVDVLAWRPTGEIQLIECKRLQLARTVAEVAEICRRFQGEAKDELDRHIQRVGWTKANPKGLERIAGFVPDPANIDHRLVTNTRVPIMYLTSLPIDASKIGPLSQ